MSEDLTQRMQHAVEAYERALAQDLIEAREEVVVRAVARADAVAAYVALQAGNHADAHMIARCAASRLPDSTSPMHLRDSVWRDFQIACDSVMQTSMRAQSIAREDAARAAAKRNAT